MIKRTLLIILLVGVTAMAGCHTGARTSVRADYYGYGGRYAPYYPAYYNPFFYPPYYYDPYYPNFFFGTSFFYGYPYYYPQNFIIVDGRHQIPPGSRSLRGFHRGSGSSGGSVNRPPSGGGGGGTQGGSGGGRSLR